MFAGPEDDSPVTPVPFLEYEAVPGIDVVDGELLPRGDVDPFASR